MVYLLQRLVYKTLKASSVPHPSRRWAETLMSMSMKHFQLHYMPQLLALTISFFFFSFSESKSKGENELRQILGHRRNPACDFPKCSGYFFLMVNSQRQRQERGVSQETHTWGADHQQGQVHADSRAHKQGLDHAPHTEKFSPDSDLHWTLEGKRGFCFKGRYGQPHPITHLQKRIPIHPQGTYLQRGTPAIFPAAAFRFHVKVATTQHPTRPQMQITVWSLTSHVFGGKS